MFVCVCASITEDVLREKIREGFDTIYKLQDHLNITCGCNLCFEDVEKMIDEVRKEQEK